jgi:rhodanese-related sulfurtransferase
MDEVWTAAAELVRHLDRWPMLVVGRGRLSLVEDLAARGLDVTSVEAEEIAWVQLDRRFHLALIDGMVLAGASDSDRRLIVHNLAAHLQPAGLLVVCSATAPVAEYDGLCRASGLEPEARYGMPAHRRIDRTTVHDLVAAARAEIRRVSVDELAQALELVTVIDTRTPTDRRRHGVIPGSVHIPRTALEWRCDPASGYAHPAIASFDQRLVVVCNEGYSSSLAAASLRRLGFTDVRDLIGGVAAWRRAERELVSPTDDDTELGPS